jgi:hypothetical protein
MSSRISNAHFGHFVRKIVQNLFKTLINQILKVAQDEYGSFVLRSYSLFGTYFFGMTSRIDEDFVMNLVIQSSLQTYEEESRRDSADFLREAILANALGDVMGKFLFDFVSALNSSDRSTIDTEPLTTRRISQAKASHRNDDFITQWHIYALA